jgi:hypothetical protein
MNTTPIMHDNSNVKSKDLYEKFSKKLNAKYLSDSTQELDEVKGILYENCHRPFGLMTIKIDKVIKNIFFIIDIGFPVTIISEEVLQAYKKAVPSSKTISIKLNKRVISANISPVGDLNILGTNFLFTHQASLSADFEQGNFNIKFGMK